MRWVAALLAAVLALLPVTGCGDDGAEPGAPQGATLVLDFTPNAVHSGIYAALSRGLYRGAGVDLEVRQPGASTDAPKLLAAGRADFAILDIHDLGIARERGIDIVGVMPIVQRPLASVIARDDRGIRGPRDLEGRTVGVTGLPSDDAVVDSEVEADGGDPSQVKRVTIGFNAVASLAAGKVDAATGFWNAEAVALRRQGTPIRVFKVDDYGAPRYPERILCASEKTLHDKPGLVGAVVGATTQGYRFTVSRPDQALDDLLDAVPSLDRAEQQAQLHVLLPALRPKGLSVATILAWLKWDVENGILDGSNELRGTFAGTATYDRLTLPR
jgi:putative hydroxymethylpyrimidine transport system substrate-binding protein